MNTGDVFFRLVAAGENLGMLVSHVYETGGLSLPMHRILGAAMAGDVSVSDIAHHSGVSRQNVQTMVNRMKEDKLLALRENPADKRAPLLRVTAAGKQAAARMDAEIARLARRFLGELDLQLVEKFLDSLSGALLGELVHAAGSEQPETSHLRRLNARLRRET